MLIILDSISQLYVFLFDIWFYSKAKVVIQFDLEITALIKSAPKIP